ncbi:hypothetical protein DJ82_12570 [Halorubrum sp. Ib24]|uniref:DUF7860 family protein n=1 Tax=unclassified Halorubrum TaxID=2642239 RepID=UPI000B98EE66|nr:MULTISPECIES: hypothetical protein [unclassified Halorubrum]OYR38400.1 hypothetical protein DJ82_12570 [Halorubrum sp. Ib24]OYR40667.1 hypothetical protein DJ81_13770 [Halorubrum sp. Hd13]OYR47523.1 hypothetical protein DJ74_12900 [Halorubrum sp. Ea8]OYR48130.1 hypothetical protein DJ75_03555 [Halorubrum sp. Eb13]OYR52649.1 hypothetical protein DJ73_10410 [Halorubrum sp. Ea1]
MAGRYGELDYSKATKRSVLLGVCLFLTGAVGKAIIHAGGLQVPGWEETLLLDLEFLGTAVALLSPFVFGILLPLTG